MAFSRKEELISLLTGSEHGLRVLQDMCDQANIGASTFVPGDPLASAYNEGRRGFMLEVLSTINKPEQSAQTFTESRFKSMLNKRAQALDERRTNV